MDKHQKARFVKLVEFLGESLGEDYEVVLHDITSKGSSIAAITNNHISNRNVNSPLTGFALDLLKNKEYLNEDYIVNYKAATKRGKNIQGSTFFIKEDEKILGMLCINHDDTKYKEVANQILKLGNIKQTSEQEEVQVLSDKDQGKNSEIVEYLSESIEDIIANILEPTVLSQDISLVPAKKQKVINALHERGVFNIKGAVLKVADILNMSEQSVYRYLKKVNK